MFQEINKFFNAINNERSMGYFGFKYPCCLDDLVLSVIDHYKSLPIPERVSFIEETSILIDTEILTCFSGRVAVLAVRTGKVEHIVDGLIAYAIEDLRHDYRDTMSALVLLYNSTQKIGFDPVQIFDLGASYATEKTAEFIKQYARSEGHSIKTWGFEESENEDGFYYKGIEIPSHFNKKK